MMKLNYGKQLAFNMFQVASMKNMGPWSQWSHRAKNLVPLFTEAILRDRMQLMQFFDLLYYK